MISLQKDTKRKHQCSCFCQVHTVHPYIHTSIHTYGYVCTHRHITKRLTLHKQLCNKQYNASVTVCSWHILVHGLAFKHFLKVWIEVHILSTAFPLAYPFHWYRMLFYVSLHPCCFKHTRISEIIFSIFCHQKPHNYTCWKQCGRSALNIRFERESEMNQILLQSERSLRKPLHPPHVEEGLENKAGTRWA